ncbi:MAG: PfaD family polyunsaturated fatty acid/polyketide biosynthesis protein [Chloroflexi bacterium]|nr:PfaD family polyunsaturated fatty acid/polyketide biosynthesis protein [Chloroflexota bacterium]OJW06255.1 MAG: 2-nitropropane dioxygenase [Chloroflexi bacterium 54-19]
MLTADAVINFKGGATLSGQCWDGPVSSVAFDETGIRSSLLNLADPVYVVRAGGRVGLSNSGKPTSHPTQVELLGQLPPLPPENLGNPAFKDFFSLKYAYAAGAMAQGIASEQMVISLGKAGMLGSFGAAGLGPARLEAAIQAIQQALPEGPYAFNLIHSPSEEKLEQTAVNLYLKHGVHTVEASAFMDLTPAIVQYRAAGLSVDHLGQVEIKNKVVAKLSRREVAAKFMQPAPEKLLRPLVEAGLITGQQATLAGQVPMADSITVEADSGGHTDNRPLVCLLPSILELRDEIQARQGYHREIMVGAGGGIGTPAAALAAFTLGADYVVTGSVNSSCIEAGNSAHTRQLLAQAEMADVIMAPSADMFELGVKVQLLKRGTFFPMRSQKLYDLYKKYDSLEEIPAAELTMLEKQFFKKSVAEIWQETEKFFSERDPEQITKANASPKRKMALIFRWYLGLSSRWSNSGEKGREMDYQIWCGPAMGAFNDWVRGSYLQDPANRQVVEVAHQLLQGAAYLYRVQSLRIQGVYLPAHLCAYRLAR